MAEKYLPKRGIQHLFIAESPPQSGKYIYDVNSKNDILLSALANGCDLEHKYKDCDKKEVLEEFQDKGFFLIDAVEEPIDGLSDNEKYKKVEEDYAHLQKRLSDLKRFFSKNTKIILISKSVFNVLIKEKHFDKEYNVLNDEMISFPSHRYWDTVKLIKKALKKSENLHGSILVFLKKVFHII